MAKVTSSSFVKTGIMILDVNFPAKAASLASAARIPCLASSRITTMRSVRNSIALESFATVSLVSSPACSTIRKPPDIFLTTAAGSLRFSSSAVSLARLTERIPRSEQIARIRPSARCVFPDPGRPWIMILPLRDVLSPQLLCRSARASVTCSCTPGMSDM